MIFYQDCSSHLDSSKNMATRGRGLFSLYIYIENFKNLLVRNHSTDFNITWQKFFLGDPLPRLFKPSGFVKNIAASGEGGGRGRVLFSLYIYIETFNNLLVRNHWTYFKITLQECFLCNSLSRLFKQSWFVKKKTWPLYIYIENFKNFLVRNHWTDFIITWQKCFFGDPLPRLFK